MVCYTATRGRVCNAYQQTSVRYRSLLFLGMKGIWSKMDLAKRGKDTHTIILLSIFFFFIHSQHNTQSWWLVASISAHSGLLHDPNHVVKINSHYWSWWQAQQQTKQKTMYLETFNASNKNKEKTSKKKRNQNQHVGWVPFLCTLER